MTDACEDTTFRPTTYVAGNVNSFGLKQHKNKMEFTWKKIHPCHGALSQTLLLTHY